MPWRTVAPSVSVAASRCGVATLQPDPVRFRRLAGVTLGAGLALVALGGAVRATDSGLACPDWPACFGQWIPPAAARIWLEHSHRLVAGAVGLLIAALLVWALLRLRHRRGVVAAAVAASVLVVVQAGLGALVVWQLLAAELVTAHLGMSFAVVACLVLLLRLAGPVSGPRASRDRGTADDRAVAWAAGVVAGLAALQSLVGAQTTGLGAGLAWQTWPLYDGAVLPAMPDAGALLHVAHRTLAVVLLGGALALAVVVRRHRGRQRAAGAWTGSHEWLVRGADAALALTLAQMALGVANLATATSPITVVPHLAVASWIWVVLVGVAAHAAWLAPARTSEAGPACASRRAEGVAA